MGRPTIRETNYLWESKKKILDRLIYEGCNKHHVHIDAQKGENQEIWGKGGGIYGKII